MLSVVSDLQVNLIVVARHRFVLTSFFPLLFFSLLFTDSESPQRLRRRDLIQAATLCLWKSYKNAVRPWKPQTAPLITACVLKPHEGNTETPALSLFFSSFYSFLVQFVLYSTWRLFFFFFLILTAISRHLSCSHKLCNAISCEVQLNVTLDPICFDYNRQEGRSAVISLSGGLVRRSFFAVQNHKQRLDAIDWMERASVSLLFTFLKNRME